MHMQNKTSIKKSVLIVDNESLIARGIQSSLNSLDNMTSHIALTGDDAIRKAIDVNPDLIVMDIKLKGDIDGLRAAKSIREKLDIPFIFLTAHSDAELLEKARETEPFAIIFKPYTERELICTVELAFQQSAREKKLKEKAHRCEKKYIELNQKMLEQAVEEWRMTFDSMPYGVLLLDMDFRIIRANKYFSKLFDISFKDMKDQKCYEIIQSDQLEKRFKDLKEYQIITLNSFEYYDERLNKYFMVYLTPIPDAVGITKTFTLALVDITEMKDKQKQLIDTRDAFFNMLKDLDVAYKDLKGLYEGLIYSFVNAIDAKSPWTKGHSERVTRYALTIACEMGLHEEERNNLRIAALLHDIGKIGTCDVILDNPNKLTSEEMSCISVHPIKGEMILKPLKQLENLLPVIRYHHERIDGRGYPEGLKGNDIPLLSRIISVADSYDSMTSDRPYRSTLGDEHAISELIKHSGTQFDSQVVEAFLRVFKKKPERKS